MKIPKRICSLVAVTLLATFASNVAAQTAGMAGPPAPDTISAEARAQMSASTTPSMNGMTLEQLRGFADQFQKKLGQAQLARYNVTVRRTTWGGVPALVFDSQNVRADRAQRLLLNFHGGGFLVDSGSLTENIELAALSGTRVISILYRLAPEYPFPAAVDDALAAYRASLARYRPENIAVYGTSAGAILTAQLLARAKAEKLPMPGAAGVFSLTADLSRDGDIEAFVPSLNGSRVNEILAPYAGSTSRTNPLLSPLFGELSGLSPTLVIASTRDPLLSQSAIYHRALLKAGVDADLIVFEGLPHAFWSSMDVPESHEAFTRINEFFEKHLGQR